MSDNLDSTLPSWASRPTPSPMSTPAVTTIRRTHLATAVGLAALAIVSGLGDLTRSDAVMSDLRDLGYPDYVATIVGVAKLLGAAAIIARGLPRLKEWAYAGFTFDYGGALASAALAGTLDADAAMAAVALTVTALSYLAFRRSLTVGAPVGLVTVPGTRR